MSLANPIQLRLTLEKQCFYQEEAAKQGKPLASYLRERLDKGDETQEAIESLRREVLCLRLLIEDFITAKSSASDSLDKTDPVFLEVILLLRQLCRPEQVKIAQGELNRLGYPIRQW